LNYLAEIFYKCFSEEIHITATKYIGNNVVFVRNKGTRNQQQLWTKQHLRPRLLFICKCNRPTHTSQTYVSHTNLTKQGKAMNIFSGKKKMLRYVCTKFLNSQLHQFWFWHMGQQVSQELGQRFGHSLN